MRRYTTSVTPQCAAKLFLSTICLPQFPNGLPRSLQLIMICWNFCDRIRKLLLYVWRTLWKRRNATQRPQPLTNFQNHERKQKTAKRRTSALSRARNLTVSLRATQIHNRTRCKILKATIHRRLVCNNKRSNRGSTLW